MTDLKNIVAVGGPGRASEFACDAIVGSDLLAAAQLPEEEILAAAAQAVEMEIGMAEIHAGSAADLDRVVFPLRDGTRAGIWLDQTPALQVVVWPA